MTMATFYESGFQAGSKANLKRSLRILISAENAKLTRRDSEKTLFRESAQIAGMRDDYETVGM